ncbi:MAG: hypothetical protein AB1631_30070, partial [Acidobacteriota bacterium]
MNLTYEVVVLPLKRFSFLMLMRSILKLPPVFGIDEHSDLGIIQQIVEPGCVLKADIANYITPQLKGKIIVPTEVDGGEVFVVEKQSSVSESYSRVLKAKLGQVGNGNTVT